MSNYPPDHDYIGKAMVRLVALMIGILIVIAGCQHIHADPVTAKAPEVVAYFSPTVEIEKRLVNEIHSEIASIRVQAYALTHTPILDALIEAAGRKVDVQIICDSSWAKRYPAAIKPAIDACAAAKIPLTFDAMHPIAHAKFIVFSGNLVEAGSYNYTAQARKNHEDALFITDQIIHDQFLIDWQNHIKHCKPAP
jgi:phosphatidylserine/phosphatidylglycerophosphate/cardiolipin synthase-like enzyme